jgi:hypothetical protein
MHFYSGSPVHFLSGVDTTTIVETRNASIEASSGSGGR